MHFFKNAIWILKKRGHNIVIGAREKEFTSQLLDYFKFEYSPLTKKGKGAAGLLLELLKQQIKIRKIIRENHIDIMLQLGGIFNAPVGKFYGIPTLAISDTENDKFGNKISFGLSKYVLSPSCFASKKKWDNQVFYPGYHELAYLSPKYFKQKINPKNIFLLRFVGWGAGHDIGEKYLNNNQKIQLVDILKNYGEVYISSENFLPEIISKYRYKFHPAKIHDFMANCKMIIGESATMASEAACLGIPAIFISNTGRGYTTEQDIKYEMIRHYHLNQWDEIINTIKSWAPNDMCEEWQLKREIMLSEKIEVTNWLVDLIESYPESIKDAQKGNFEKFQLNN